MRYADSLLPQRFVDSTKGEFMEDVVRCSMATGLNVEDPPNTNTSSATTSSHLLLLVKSSSLATF